MRRFIKKAVAGCLAVALATGSLSVPRFTMEVHAEERTDADTEKLDAEIDNKGADVENEDSEKKSKEKKSENKDESIFSKDQTSDEANVQKDQTSDEVKASKDQTSDEVSVPKDQSSNAVDAVKPSDEKQASQENSDLETFRKASVSEIPKENTGEEACPEETKNILTIHLTKDVFKKTYGARDPETIDIGRDYDIVGEAPEYKPYLRVDNYTREDGEEPGRYAITSIHFKTKYDFDEIKLNEEQVSFTIEKKKYPSIYDRKKKLQIMEKSSALIFLNCLTGRMRKSRSGLQLLSFRKRIRQSLKHSQW